MRVLVFILTWISFFRLSGQDPFFSSQENAASFFSPSLTGNFEEDWKAALTYRTQWFGFENSPGFNTLKASFEYKLPSVTENAWTIGMNLVSDEILNSKYRLFLLQASAAYKLQLGSLSSNKERRNFLTLGSQIGLAQSSFGWNHLWFGRQYDLNIFSVNLEADSGEPNSGQMRSNSDYYPDINLGVSLEFWTDRKLKIRTDLAAKHLNAPSQNFRLVSSSTLDPTFSAMLRVSYYHSKNLVVESDLVSTLQGPFEQYLLRSGIRLRNEYDGSFGFNLAGRLNNTINGSQFDAIIFGLSVGVERFEFGVSYDFYVSGISQSDRSLSAFELNVAYKASKYY